LNFWEALGLLALARILVGWKPGSSHHHSHFRRHWYEKLKGMSEEEKEKFREEWRRRCGWDKSSPPSSKDEPAD
jgi:hypothetical protein